MSLKKVYFYYRDYDLKRNKKLVAIVVPMFDRVELTPEEEISKKHLIYYVNVLWE